MHRRDMVRSLAILLAVLVASPAHARVLFFTSFAYGVQAQPTPVDFSYWAPQPTPTGAATPHWPMVSTVPSPLPVPSGVVDRYGLRFRGVSGADSYQLIQHGISGTLAKLALSFVGFYITDPGPAGSVCDLGWLGTASARGLQASFTSNGAGNPVTLKVYTTDNTTTRCFGSNVDGRRCAADTDISDDCPSTNPVETTCAVPTFASVDVPLQSYRNVQIQQINGSGSSAGRLTGNLWEGPMGSAYSRAGGTYTVGECDTTRNPCNVNGDCTSPDTFCSLANVVGITTAGVGKKDTGTCAADWFVSCIALQDDDTPSANLYCADLDPSAIPTPATNWDAGGSAHGCDTNNRPACLNDGANSGPDGSSSYLQDSAPFANQPTIGINLTDPATPTAAATPIAFAFVVEGVGSDQTSATDANSARVMPLVGTATPAITPAPFNFDDFAGTGGASAPSYLLPPFTWSRDFTTSEANSLSVEIRKTAGGSGDTPRITSLVGTLLYRTADPIVPAVIPDRDQDGQDTVCWATNSRGHSSNPTYRANVKAGLLEPTNLYWYSRGGANQGDLNAQISALIEGASGGFIPLDVQRGTGGKTCDILIAEMSANNLNPGTVADPQLASSYQGLSQQGACEDNGGANQGGPCVCPNGIGNETSQYGYTPAPQITPGARYCVNSGDFRHECRDSAGVKSVACACTVDADCRRGGDASGGACVDGLCQVTNGLVLSANAASSARASLCEPGCTGGLGCTNGVCVAHHTLARNVAFAKELQAAANARPTPNPAATPAGTSGKPIVVHVFDPPGNGLAGWGKEMHPMASAVRSKLRRWALTNNYPFIDLWARFRREGDPYHTCCNGTVSGCTGACVGRGLFRDFPHYNDQGQAVQAQIEVECLTNALPGEAAGTRTHDGICTNNVCTGGMVGNACTAGTVIADCATWSCNFGAQP